MRRPRAPRRTASRLAAVAALTTLTVAGCGIGSTGTTNAALGGPTGKPITVGMSLSLTGQFQVDGQAFLKGYELWRDYVNSHGGLSVAGGPGRPIKLVYLDDKSDPATCTKDYTTLITQDHVDLLFGPFSSLLTVSAAQVAHKYNYAFVEGAGGAPSVYDLNFRNLFGVSAPVAQQLMPFAQWVAKLPLAQRPKTAAYAYVDDIFADPPVDNARTYLQTPQFGIQTVFSNANPGPHGPNQHYGLLKNESEGQLLQQITNGAKQIAALHPDMVVLATVDVPSLAQFIKVFHQQNYNPKFLIATSGPDQGQGFLSAIGTGNATGVMVPNGWYGGLDNPLSHVMVQNYIATYGGTAADINADVAEAYSVGQVMADAVSSPKVGLNQQKIINYLHSGVTLDTVQGTASWPAGSKLALQGQNLNLKTFIFQWLPGSHFDQVLAGQGQVSKSTPPLFPKPAWVG